MAKGQAARIQVVTKVFSEKTGWVLPDACAEQIRAASDRIVLTVPTSKADFADALGDAEVVFGSPLSADELPAADKLKWIQLASAGADNVLTPEFVRTDVVLTTAAGIHRIQISEHVLAMMLMFARRIHEYAAAQVQAKWNTEIAGRMDELFEKTLGIVGLGNIGREVARKAKVFGMRVIATRRHADQAAAPDVDELLQPAQLDALLERSDYVVLAVPLTAATAKLIGTRELELMKPTAFLVNIARGAVVDEAALVDALRQGKIAGAGLDTFETEPLPEDSPLWRMPNAIITPHRAGTTPRYWQRATALFCENLNRYIEGKPLRNLVSRDDGY